MTTATLTRTSSDLRTPAVERVESISQFAGMREEWNELLQSSESNCMFLTWEWLHTWWRHLAGNRKLSILAVRSEGQLTAIAPLAVRPAGLYPLRPLPVMELLGTGSVGSDYLDCVVRKGYEHGAGLALAAAVANERYMLDWKQLNRGKSCAAAVASHLHEKGWDVSERSTNVCPFIRLAGKSWTSYLDGLSAQHRYNFNRKLRRLNQDFEVQFEQVRGEEQLREAIELVFELHNGRWQRRGGSDAFHRPELLAFHREFSRLALDRSWLRLYVLRLNNAAAVCLYGFLYGRTFYFYQSGFDETYDRYSVGLVTMGLAIRNAIEENAEEYDLLHGSESYKSHWSHESRELSNLQLYPPGRLGRLCRTSVEFDGAARRIARGMLGERAL